MGDIHNRKKYLDRTVEKLENSELSQHNVDLILELKEALLAEDLSTERVCRYMTSFNTLDHLIDFKLDEATKRDINRLAGQINQNKINDKNYSPWTLAEFKKAILKFYKHQEGITEKKEKPEVAEKVKVNVKKNEKPKTDPDELPKPSDVADMVKAAQNKRDKALIFLTWDTGARIGEILNLKWKDVKFGEELTTIRIRHSKTEPRPVPIRSCVETLKDWREEHPEPELDNYVFIKLRKDDPEDDHYPQLAYDSARVRFSRLADQADVDCKSNPHAFRKGRATNLASQGMNQAQLCEYFGWVQGSDQAATYIRMSEKDTEKAVKRIHGMEVDEEDEETLTPTECANCGTTNSAVRDYCKECNEIISDQQELIKQKKEEKLTKEVNQDILDSLFEEMGYSEEEKHEFMDKKVKQKIENEGLEEIME